MALGCVIAAVCAAGKASASAPEVFGFGSEQAALVGAVAARVNDFSSAFYNPAGLTGVRAPEASFGVLGFGSLLSIDQQQHRRQPIAEPIGIVIGAAAPLPLRSFLRDRLFFGIGLYVVPDAVVRVIAHAPDEPFFPYYDNRTQRLVVLPSLAVRIGGGFSAGLALNYLAGLDGKVTATEGLTRAIEPRVDEHIFATARVNLGARWQSPRERVAVALCYRQRFSVPFRTVAQNRVAGQPLDLSIEAEGLFTPDELVGGTAVRVLPWLRLSADLTVSLWSGWRGPYVTVVSNLPIVGSLSAPPPVLGYRDVVSLRLGGEAERVLSPSWRLLVRAGYGFETSPLPAEQPGVTNLLDGPKHFFGLGAGVRVARGGVRMRIDAHGQLHVMQAVTLTKQIAPPGTRQDPATALRDERPDDPNHPETLGVQVSNPGYPSITGGGAVWSAGVTLTVER